MGTTTIETRPAYALNCLICGDTLGVYYTVPNQYAVCDKCRKAVLYVREQMKNKTGKTENEGSYFERSNQTGGDWVVRNKEPL